MRSQMHLQHAVVGKPSATHKADKSASIPFIYAGVVATHVFVQVAALCKRAIALRTNVWSFAGVQAKMSLQVATLSKTAVARLTDKRTFPGVNSLMSLQV